MQAGGVSEILQRVEGEIQSRRLLLRAQKLLVAVSGGADSMVLLHILLSLAGKNRWKISVAHFNHQLRGRASFADEKLVRKTAAELKLPVVVERADVKAFAKQAKISVEMAARKLRHEFLARIARKKKNATVALAHHADDQVELFFVRLLRGAGGEGLAGMKWRSPSSADKKISLIRPLLGFSKAELLEFVRENKICFRDDATNFSTDFLRNRIRNELLPLLQKNYQPGLAKTILRQMEIVGAESEFVGAAARQWLRSCGCESAQTNNQSRLTPTATAEAFEALSVAVQRKVLQGQLTARGIVSDFDLIEQLRLAPGKFVSVNSGSSVMRDAAGKLAVREESVAGFNSDEQKLDLQGRAGQAAFGGLKLRWALKTPSGAREPVFAGLRPDRRSPRQTEFFDADQVGGEVVLRHWRAGDRFQPIGLKSPVKLQDLFVNAKIPADHRRGLVLAESARGIFWVQGLRIGEVFKLTAATKRKLDWNWRVL
jgi:tRNA(Ile)-lysidine synthase